MKHYLNSFPVYVPADVYDYVYHFYVETIWHQFVEVSKSDYMDVLKACRRFDRKHHVDVHEYDYRSYNLFLGL